MTNTINEYAEALFALAGEENIKDEIYSAVNEVDKIFNENPEYLELLASPVVAKNERIELINKAFGEFLPEYMLSFLKLLCEKGHIAQYSLCAKVFNELFSFSNKVSQALVTSAVELDDDEKQKLIKKLEKMCGHTVELDLVVDKSILGGMIIEMDGKIIDASMRRHINDVKDVISK